MGELCVCCCCVGPRKWVYCSLQAYCTYPMCVQCSHFHRHVTTTLEIIAAKGGTIGRETSGNLAESSEFHATLGIFYMPQIYDMGPKALLTLRRKSCWGFFRPKKSDGFGRVWTWVLKASAQSLDHRSRLNCVFGTEYESRTGFKAPTTNQIQPYEELFCRGQMNPPPANFKVHA
jgi:hypothetical protein